MKTFRATCLVAAFLEFLGAACSKRQEENPPVPAPVTADGQPPSSKTTPSDGGPAPAISLSANGSRHAEAYRGWPIILEASFLHPGVLEKPEDVSPIILAARQGPWPRAIHLEVKTAQGGSLDWSLEPAGAPETTLTLDAKTSGAAAWLVSPETSSRIAEGTYDLTAVLDTSEASLASAWKGKAASVPVTVRLASEPSPLNPALEEYKHRVFADYYGLRGERQKALAEADAWLARFPASIGGLALKAGLLTDAGKLREALALYDQAIEAWSKENPKAQEPPRELLRKRRALRNELMKE
ncbi:MAG: hypothetical protein HY717_02760 [Planctomycetes bacterium]|nr:hypothetical protein [Planctomycetota bacterium]